MATLEKLKYFIQVKKFTTYFFFFLLLQEHKATEIN